MFSLLFTNDLITSAPSYQWNGIGAMSVFIAAPAVFLAIPGLNKGPNIISFLTTFTAQTALRAWIMKHHLPFETLFLGTLSSPAFFLFVFFMLTDPATSPQSRRGQIAAGVSIATLDLLFHVFQSYYTFFYAGFTYAAGRFIFGHARNIIANRRNIAGHLRRTFVVSHYWRGPTAVAAIGGAYLVGYAAMTGPYLHIKDPGFRFRRVLPLESGIDTSTGDLFDRVDTRVQHVIKWLFSVGASVAAGDIDQDGRADLVFTAPLMQANERVQIFLNKGNFRFEELVVPQLRELFQLPENNGIATQALLVDYDNDRDLHLYLSVSFGSPRLFQNQMSEGGGLVFKDVTFDAGLDLYSISLASTFFDFNQDGYLDLFLANVLPLYLPDYETPTQLNLFHLPQPEYPGDERMFHFMHRSWHDADNGGKNVLLLRGADGRFHALDSDAMGLGDTRWSLAVGSADLNQDGWPDIYVANDFGPDRLYLNERGERLKSVEGKLFGSIGKDTYKGMNVSIEDLDGNGWQDVYVSNVHHAMQAEGSLLWLFGPAQNPSDFIPRISDNATYLGILNPRRFGWGATIGDFNNDGNLDVGQANGMVDDRLDRRFEKCPDYWYTNEKIARSPPSIHSYANKWGDIRGYCIYGREKNRLYLNRGNGKLPQFVDIADSVGLDEETNSRGMASVDLDNDGYLDLVITHMFQPPTLLETIPERSSQTRSLEVQLESHAPRCNTQAVGSKVTVAYTNPAGDRLSLSRFVQIASGFSGQNPSSLHFGLGKAPRDIELTVDWCSLGEVRTYEAASGSLQRLTYP